DWAVLRVKDNGLGIDPELLPRVFDLFMRAAGGGVLRGLGVGLALARSFVEMHGGSIEARSEGLGRGSEFGVRLPTGPAAAPPSTEAGAHQGEGEGPLRVLVVDDSKEVAESVGRLLEFWGYDMHVAYDGPTGLELAQRYR